MGQDVDALIDDLLAECDPKSTDNIRFRGAQYDRGLAWVHFPFGFGGLGLEARVQRHIETRLREAGAPPPQSMLFFNLYLAAPTMVTHGSDELRKRALRPMFTGEDVWCQLFSEPGSGSDLAGLSTRAIRDGDGWRVSMTTLMNERTTIGSGGGGGPKRGSGSIAEALYTWRHTSDHSPTRRDQLMKLWCDAEVLRLTNIRAAQKARMGVPGPE